MTRRGAAVLASILLLLGLAAQTAAAPPAGPRLAISVHDDRGSNLVTTGPAGEAPRRLIDSDLIRIGDRPSWSADGSRLAFLAKPLDPKLDAPVLAMIEGDGSDLRTIPRVALEEGDPVIAPDGRSVVFPLAQLVRQLPGRENVLLRSSIWSFDLRDRSLSQATPWRLADLLWPSSFSPDGSTIAVTSFSRHGGLRAVAIDLRTGRRSLLARKAMEPTYSPDGSRFAFVRYRYWRLDGDDQNPPPAIDELRVGRVGAVAGGRLVLRKRGIIAWPSWDPSGSRLAFTHSPAEELGDRRPEEGNRVMAINADGSCLTRVFTDPDLTLYGAAWQPGPGREAGPIAC